MVEWVREKDEERSEDDQGRRKEKHHEYKLDLALWKELVNDGCGGQAILSSQGNFFLMSRRQLRCVIRTKISKKLSGETKREAISGANKEVWGNLMSSLT